MSSISVNMRNNNVVVKIYRVGGGSVREVPGTIDFTAGSDTPINTLQSDIKPKFITVFDENGKRIDKNLPEPTVELDTTYRINYPKIIGLSFNNCKVYYQ